MDRNSAEHEGGQGPWLVLLHGLTGIWQIWTPVILLLEKHFRVLAITLPGHAGGPALAAGKTASVHDMADQIADMLRARGIESAHIAGNSLGGWLALELARRGLALSVTALSPAGGWQTDRDYMQVARPFRIIYAALAVLRWIISPLLRFAGFRKAAFAQNMEHGDRLSPRDSRQFLRAVRGCRILPALLRSMRQRGPVEPLQLQDVPICIAWAEHDRVIPFDVYGKPLFAAVPQAQAQTIPGAGHVPMYDAPDTVAALILGTAQQADTVASAVA